MQNRLSVLVEFSNLKFTSGIQAIRQALSFPRGSTHREIRYFDSENLMTNAHFTADRNYTEFSIVIQGPINEKAKNLFRDIDRYFSLYPGIHIVLSTWALPLDKKLDAELSAMQEKYPETLHILRADQLGNSGISNVNSQIYTTRKGLEFSKTLGSRFVIKSRTDQSLNNPKFLLKLERKYLHRCMETSQKPIVLSSKNSFLFRPYSFSDMLQFSDIDTLLSFWSLDFDSRSSLKDVPAFPSTLADWSKNRFAEVFLSSTYLESLGESLDFTLKHYHECLVKYFVIIDADSIGHYWTKYSIRTNGDVKLHCPYPKYEISEFDYAQIVDGEVSYLSFEDKIKSTWT